MVEAGDPGHALAIARAEARAFEVLVTDMVMPGMDGRTLARELQALQEGLVVVYVSGYSPEHLVEEGLLEEDTPLLTKPFDRLELAARIEQALAARPEVVGAGSKP